MQSDCKEFIESLTDHGVDYMVFGAHALAYYGRPRYTEDLDVVVRRTEENLEKLLTALLKFGLPVSRVAIERLFHN